MKSQTQLMIATTLLAIAVFAIGSAPCDAQCLGGGQPVTAFYPTADSCSTGACGPVVATAYRPPYRPLFAGSTARRYDRLMRRWNRWWSRNEPVALGAPVAMTVGYGSTCNSCPSPCTTTCCSPVTCYKPQQCCRYVPQTCYRTEYCNVPVTTYRPVTSCDPCTGCVTTCMKPCTTYAQQARQVPYTTYRMVCETRYTPVTSCLPVSCGSCEDGCVTGNCATGNCATGNCATGNCATGVAPSISGQTTEQPTLSPSTIQSNKPESRDDVNIEINPEVEYKPMRDLDDRHDPSIDSDYPEDDKMAALDVSAKLVRSSFATEPVVQATGTGGWRASSR